MFFFSPKDWTIHACKSETHSPQHRRSLQGQGLDRCAEFASATLQSARVRQGRVTCVWAGGRGVHIRTGADAKTEVHLRQSQAKELSIWTSS